MHVRLATDLERAAKVCRQRQVRQAGEHRDVPVQRARVVPGAVDDEQPSRRLARREGRDVAGVARRIQQRGAVERSEQLLIPPPGAGVVDQHLHAPQALLRLGGGA
jgi:hypothetical protein